MEPFSITIEGYDVIEKEVKSGGNSGRVFVPKSWLECKVKVILIEEPQEQHTRKEKTVHPFEKP